MHKKIIMACMAIAAFAAFVVAPAASASPTLTDVTADKTVDTLKPGAWIVGTALENKLTAGFTLECESSQMNGTVVTNSGTLIEAEVTSATFSGDGTNGDCTNSSVGNFTVTTTESLPWCIKAEKGSDNFSIRGGKCNEAAKPLTFTLHTSLVGTCHYTRATAITGSVNTGGTDAILTVSEAEFEKEPVSGVFCPSSGKLDMRYTLETTDKTPITVS